jgi:hypothetical protein
MEGGQSQTMKLEGRRVAIAESTPREAQDGPVRENPVGSSRKGEGQEGKRAVPDRRTFAGEATSNGTYPGGSVSGP